MRRRWLGFGILTGLLVTAPVMALLYMGAQFAGLPFTPFDLFNAIARLTPGNVITVGIDAIVTTIDTFNLGETSSTAKLIEQFMALGIVLVLGAIGAAIFFAIQRRSADRPQDGFSGAKRGLILGGVGAFAALILYDLYNQTASTDLLTSVIWLSAIWLGWGAAIGWIYGTLEAFASSEPTEAEQPSASPEAQVVQAATDRTIKTTQLTRRQFMTQIGGVAAIITVSGAGVGLLSGNSSLGSGYAVPFDGDTALPPGLPNERARLIPAPGTRPEYTPLNDHYRIDISVTPPRIGDDWALPINGLVDNPLSLSLEDIRNNYEPMEQYITMACISNRIGGDLTSTTKWTGANLQQILADAGVQENARYLVISSSDGFHETVALDLINSDDRIMMAYDWDDQPLRAKHGFPLRIYLPDRYGMKQPKWITDIQVVSEYEEGYWVRRGWDEVARMNTVSVIDTVAQDALIDDNGRILVPVGGIAHAGARGISKVEVRVDEGEWQEAQLRDPISETTWSIWRYDWPFEEGRHTFAVRAYDGTGEVQEVEERGARPSGSTGTHTRTAVLA